MLTYSNNADVYLVVEDGGVAVETLKEVWGFSTSSGMPWDKTWELGGGRGRGGGLGGGDGKRGS